MSVTVVELLALIRDLCEQQGDIDGAALACAAGISLPETVQLIELIDAEGLAVVEEYGFSCSVEYTITGLTDAGQSQLST